MYKYITEFNNINYLNVFYQCTRVDNVIVMSSEVIQITELANFITQNINNCTNLHHASTVHCV